MKAIDIVLILSLAFIAVIGWLMILIVTHSYETLRDHEEDRKK